MPPGSVRIHSSRDDIRRVLFLAKPPDTFRSHLKTGYNLSGCHVERGLLLSVSGGADSVALMRATVQLWPDLTEHIAVAHIDHSLRDDSSRDAAFVADMATALGLRCEQLTIPAGRLADERGMSVEQAARAARYDFLAATARKLDLHFVATAHHMDDQAETVLHNIMRGTGLRGMRGMQRTRTLAADVQIVRPMLQIRRAAIENFLSDQKQTFQVDQSNLDLSFTRNRLRQQLLPRIKSSINEAADRHLVSLAEPTEHVLEALDALAQKILSDALLDQQPDVCRIDRSKLNDWPEEIIRHVLSVLWIHQHWPRRKMTFAQYSRLAEAAVSGQSGRFDLPGGVTAQFEQHVVRLSRGAPPA